ncbi:MAG TPA: ABC transporter permease subunit [Vicinamibacteria bacterium]|nr:ABC transporter permease subunit [Vicinamibacteria bacterium]
MPVYEQAYRRHQGRGPLRAVRFWPITREALALILAKRGFLLLLGGAWLQFVGRVIQIFVVTRFPDAARVVPIDGRLFGDFLNQQVFWTLLVSTFGGAGLVANDLRTGAILVYLSRPLTRRDYILGKLGVLLALNLGVTLLPALLLYAVGLGLAPDLYLKRDLVWVAPAIVLQGTVLSLAVALLALAVSALSRNARLAGLSFFGLLAGLQVARQILVHVVGAEWATPLSPWANFETIAARLFGMPARADPLHAAAVLALVMAASLLVLRARVRAVEIVR